MVLLAATLSSQAFGSQVNLSSAYNRIGIYTDGTKFAGNAGIDGVGTAYSANVLNDMTPSGTNVTVGSSQFHLAAANVPNVVASTGQTIALSSGSYRYLKLLGTAVGGNQENQVLQVHYTDGSTDTFRGSLSDWFSQGVYPNESLAIRPAYRTNSDGTHAAQPFNIYLYTVPLKQNRRVKSITLPNNPKAVFLSMTLSPFSIVEYEPYVCSLLSGN